jgi:hypothetical protein
MILAALSDWTTRQVDFVFVFPQAPVETGLYMNVPTGFDIWITNEQSTKVGQ